MDREGMTLSDAQAVERANASAANVSAVSPRVSDTVARLNASAAQSERNIRTAYHQVIKSDSPILRTNNDVVQGQGAVGVRPPNIQLYPADSPAHISSFPPPPPPLSFALSHGNPEANRASADQPQQFLESGRLEVPNLGGLNISTGHRVTQQGVTAPESSVRPPLGSPFSNT